MAGPEIMDLPTIAVIVVTYNSERDIGECVEHLSKVEYPAERLRVFIHDNASTDQTPHLLKSLTDRLQCEHEVTLSPENLGFTGGNNAAFEKARKAGCEYVFLLNPDAFLEPRCLARMVETMADEPHWALAQPLLVLAQDPTLLNTSGNEMHVLGFGLVVDSGRPRGPVESGGKRLIGFPSGAACLVRIAALERDEPLFEPFFFAYHEDCELSWRLQLRGWKAGLDPQAVVSHRYAFSKGLRKFYYLERNRWYTMLMHYRCGTLLLLAPILLLAGVMVWGHAVLHGWFRLKCRVCLDLWRQRRTWMDRRRFSFEHRKLRDRELLDRMSSALVFPDGTPWPVRYALNPICRVYGGIVRKLVYW